VGAVDNMMSFHESGADEWGLGMSIDRLPAERTATHISTMQIKTTFFIRVWPQIRWDFATTKQRRTKKAMSLSVSFGV
jgi:hypothetical protein